jgi:hypothetical protein
VVLLNSRQGVPTGALFHGTGKLRVGSPLQRSLL